jgi:pimeloyl-ACP methyl ester carboxylesterase
VWCRGLITAGSVAQIRAIAFLVVYDQVRTLSRKPDVIRDLPTEFGVVRVYQHGPDGGIPVVLLHCFWATSAMWADHVAALIGEFTVFTIDMLGQPGASVQSKAMLTANHCARCIDQVLNGLDLDGVHLVGHSYGGSAALQIAARAPARLASVTLAEPCNSVARLPGKFWRNGVVLVLPGVERKRRIVEKFCGHPSPGSQVENLVQLFMAAGGGGEFASVGTPFPSYPRDALLRSVEIPDQVLMAGKTIHDSAKGIERIRNVMPAWRYRLWPDASHMLPCEAADEVSDYIGDFARETIGKGRKRVSSQAIALADP